MAFDPGAGRLDMGPDFSRGTRLACPEPGSAERQSSVRDTVNKARQHPGFFKHQAYPFSARLPSARCPSHGVHLVELPRARPGSGFMLLFEVTLLTYAKQMPVAPVESIIPVNDAKIWRALEHHVP